MKTKKVKSTWRKNHFYKSNRMQMYYIITNKANTKKDEVQRYEEIKS